MKETDYILIYKRQIICNSQDTTITNETYISSGTGDPFALNAATPEEDSALEPDEIMGETLLCLDLDAPINAEDIFSDPLEYMKKAIQDPNCHMIINQDFEVCGNRSEDIVRILRQEESGKTRQFIYRESKELESEIWDSGSDQLPRPYDPNLIDHDSGIHLRTTCRFTWSELGNA